MSPESFDVKVQSITVDPETDALLTAHGFQLHGWIEVDDDCTEDTLIETIEEFRQAYGRDNFELAPTLAKDLSYRELAIYVRHRDNVN